MPVRRRQAILACFALALATVAFGPRLYFSTLPYTAQLVARGGTWSELTTGAGTRHRVVVHRIPEHCFSPGVGVAVQAGRVPTDSIVAMASLLAGLASKQAVQPGDRYVTVFVALGDGHHWPWSRPDGAHYAWHRSSRDGRWKLLSSSRPLGR
jgi:hypothetical protein